MMREDADRFGRQALDRLEIEEAARRFGRGLDGRTPEDERNFDKCFTDDVEVIYESSGFPIGTWRGIEHTKIAVREATRTVFTWTQHMFLNSLIEIHGDEADAEYYVFAAHGFEGKVLYAGCVYRQKVRRMPVGWRISRHECISNWIDDSGGLLKALMKACRRNRSDKRLMSRPHTRDTLRNSIRKRRREG